MIESGAQEEQIEEPSEQGGDQTWRERVRLGLLRTMAVAGVIALLITTPVLFLEGQPVLGIVYWLLFAPFLWFAFSKRLPSNVRLAGLLGTIYVFGLGIGVGERRLPEVGVYLLSLCIMAVLLGGWRWAAVTGGVAAVSYVGLAWVNISGALGPAPFTAIDPESAGNWITFGANFAIFAASLTVSIGYVVTYLERALARSRALSQSLEQEVAAKEREMEAREKAEATLVHAQKMEIIGRLAGGIAHDFNNLLTPILFGITRGLDDADAKDREDLEVAHDSVMQAKHLTRQLLTFSRRDVADPRVVDLRRALRHGLRVAKRLVSREVSFESDVASEPMLVRVDEVQLQLVLLNLIANARDAMPSGGTVRVEAAREGADVWLAVSDDGVGMPEEVRQRVFEPFFTTKGAGRGTGLGLFTARELVERYDGEIEVHSEPGAGSQFRIRLPIVADAVEDADPSGEAERPTGGDERVLVVDDDLRVRAVMVSVLTDAGYRVADAGDGAAALRLAEDGASFDLVVSDVMLPGDDGPTLVAKLQALQPGLRCVFCTGFAPEEVLGPLASRRDVRILQKPFSRDELLLLVRRALDERLAEQTAG